MSDLSRSFGRGTRTNVWQFFRQATNFKPMKKSAPLKTIAGAIILSLLFVFAYRCTPGGSQSAYKEEGLDKVIKDYRDKSDFIVILYDMNYERNKYLHQYQILIESPDSSFEQEVSEWLPVSERFFQRHIDDLGMELASKKNNVLSKKAAPAGYSNYVGNPSYGRWTQRNGNSFWEFYGKFAFMNSMFNLLSRPARRDYWNDYDRNYRRSGRAYYGPGGSYYGTRGYTSSSVGKKSTWAQQPSSFKQKVRSQVSRSKPSSSRSSKSSTTKTTRSTSRYSSSSSYRSRGGGYGGK